VTKPRMALDRAGRVARQVAKSATDIARAVRGDDCPDDGRGGSPSDEWKSDGVRILPLSVSDGAQR
ncbi:hypothetical protein, partial [Salmonella enterica]|uniref:hypothetical protein n=1 Tax=Salmonella enterica TaxID=28901 RepID=UPI003CF168A3